MLPQTLTELLRNTTLPKQITSAPELPRVPGDIYVAKNTWNYR